MKNMSEKLDTWMAQREKTKDEGQWKSFLRHISKQFILLALEEF